MFKCNIDTPAKIKREPHKISFKLSENIKKSNWLQAFHNHTFKKWLIDDNRSVGNGNERNIFLKTAIWNQKLYSIYILYFVSNLYWNGLNRFKTTNCNDSLREIEWHNCVYYSLLWDMLLAAMVAAAVVWTAAVVVAFMFKSLALDAECRKFR